jgi:cyclopropane fatty-acyl-phospholipid synthase-like methyltransferase
MALNSRAEMTIVAVAVAAAVARAAAGQLASRPAEEWAARLERPERIAGLKIDYIVQKLDLKPGQVVADIGAGPGVISIPLAKAVAPGKVYAEDIDKAFFDHVDKRAREQHVTNIVNVLGEANDPKLPARDVDVALFHDVLHHIQDRAGYLKTTAQYVKPSGRIAIIELPPDGSHKDEPDLVVTKDQVKQWMGAAGFAPVEEIGGLNEGKWFIVYARQAQTHP